MIVFDGEGFARKREHVIREKVASMSRQPRVLSIVFQEDAASQLYTRLKIEAASRVGIGFDRVDVSMVEDVAALKKEVQLACLRDDVDGVLIQKPAKKTWMNTVHTHAGRMDDFRSWWLMLVSELTPSKDVDCLSEENLSKIYDGSWTMLPATVAGIMTILGEALQLTEDLTRPHAGNVLGGKKAVVVGASRIVGHPVAGVLKHFGADVVNVGSGETDLDGMCREADILVSATGREGLITGEMVKEGVIAIDVGSPRGDMDFESVSAKAAFVTPVPGGVGPMTVVSLLENLLLISR